MSDQSLVARRASHDVGRELLRRSLGASDEPQASCSFWPSLFGGAGSPAKLTARTPREEFEVEFWETKLGINVKPRSFDGRLVVAEVALHVVGENVIAKGDEILSIQSPSRSKVSLDEAGITSREELIAAVKAITERPLTISFARDPKFEAYELWEQRKEAKDRERNARRQSYELKLERYNHKLASDQEAKNQMKIAMGLREPTIDKPVMRRVSEVGPAPSIPRQPETQQETGYFSSFYPF